MPDYRHKLTRRLFLTLLSSATVFFGGGFRAKGAPSAPQAPKGAQGRCALGWVPYWDQTRAFRTFKQNVDIFEYVSLFWYYLDKGGKVKKYSNAHEDRRIIDFAHRNGVKVLGIIANLPDDKEPDQTGHGGEGWDERRVRRVIKSRSRRKRHIADLVALAKKMDFDGINIDYEALRRRQRGQFSAFIRELGEALHAEGKILAVALHPKTSERNPREDNGSHAQDWDAIHPYADQLHLMTYGQHTSASRPGAIASPRWMERVLIYALYIRKVPRNKIFLGIPLYAEAWHHVDPDCRAARCYEGLNEDLTYTDVLLMIRKFGARVRWSSRSASPHISYEEDGVTHIVWFENRRSVAKKLLIREKYGVCHVGLWRLGGEDPEVWPLLRKAVL